MKKAKSGKKNRLTDAPGAALRPVHFFASKPYSIKVQLKICQRCKRPFLTRQGACSHCPEPASWNRKSWAGFVRLAAIVLPLLVMLAFWLLMVVSFSFR